MPQCSMAAKRKKAARGRGRPPAGKAPGEEVRDYPRLTVRLPPATMTMLQAWSEAAEEPMWRLIDAAVWRSVNRLPKKERRPLLGRAARARRLAV
jgi:hypothetical protein